MWDAIIGAAASVIGGLFGGKKKEQTASHVDYKRLVRDAEAAGFNPLTALRNGGAAGYSVTTSPGAPLTSRVAEAVSGGVQNFLANYDPFKDQRREAEFKVHEANLANLQADTALKQVQARQIGSVPTYTASNMKRVVGSGVKHGQTFKSSADVLPPEAGASQTPTVEQPTVTNPYPTGSGIHINPGLPDVASYEDRYGDSEIASTIAGGVTFLGDYYHNLGRIPGVLRSYYDKASADYRSQRKKSLNDNYHQGTNIYGLPPGQIPGMIPPPLFSSPKR